MRRRSIEFLLDLDVGKLEAERLLLRSREAKLQDSWRAAVRAFKDTLRGQGLVTVRLPESLTVAWPPQEPPIVAESHDSKWIALDDLLMQLRAEQADLDAQEVPRVQPIAPETEQRLGAAFREADALRQAGALMREDMLRDHSELRSVRERIGALREDLREHQDIVTLQRLGSTELEGLHGDCPVCHQQLPTSLLGAESPVRTLSPTDTVAYIRQQIELFEVMERDGERTLQAKDERLAALRAEAANVRAQIRALRTTLTEPNGTPSMELVTRRVRLQDRVERLRSVGERFLGLLGELDRLAEDGRKVRAAIQRLPADRVSPDDRQKLAQLEKSFIEQLRAYDFGSFSDEQLSISTDDYLPRREDFDLQADISASDSIRVVWAYLLGLVEVSERLATNHPGLLVFDEPRQQSTKAVSFKALLQRSARDAAGCQVIFATSEELDSLRRMLDGLPHTLHAIDGYVLQPVTE